MNGPESPLAGRYRFVGAFEWAAPRTRWLAHDERSARAVTVGLVPAREAPAYERVREERHPHLATILDVIVDPPKSELPQGVDDHKAAAVVAEYVRGRTLHQHLAHGPLLPFKAVAWLLRLIDAVQFLRGHGIVHGGISPRSVVAEPKRRVIAPVLACFTAPSIGGYVTPERLKGAVARPEDDAWGLYATFYAMLTAHAALRGNERELLVQQALASGAKPLSDFGLDEPVLQEAIARGLHPNARQRATALDHLATVLDAWERNLPPPAASAPPPVILADRRLPTGRLASAVTATQVVCDVSTLADHDGAPQSADPDASASVSPVPPSVAAVVAAQPAAVSPPTQPARAAAAGRRTWIWATLAVVLVIVGGIAGGFALRSSPAAGPVSGTVAGAVTASVSSAPSAAPPPALTPAEQQARCIREYLPEDALDQSFDESLVCGGQDFREVARRLYAFTDPPPDTDAGAAAPLPPETGDGGVLVVRGLAPRRPKRLGWYELLAAAMIRKSCCPDAPAVELPTTQGNCLQLGALVRKIADLSRRVADVTPATKEFEEAVVCLFASGMDRPYPYSGMPSDENRAAFQKFLQRVAEIDARKSALRRKRRPLTQ